MVNGQDLFNKNEIKPLTPSRSDLIEPVTTAATSKRTKKATANVVKMDEPLVIDRVDLDAGNREIKWKLWVNGQPMTFPGMGLVTMPSVIKENVRQSDFEVSRPGALSALLTLDDVNYIVGLSAVGGKPTHERKNKCEVTHLFLLSVLSKLIEQYGEPDVELQVVIKQLVVLIPNTANQVSLSWLEQCRHLKAVVNKDFPVNVTCEEIIPVNETEPAYHYLVQQGLINPMRLNVVWSIGGHDSIMRLYRDGMIDRDSEIGFEGTFKIADMVSLKMKGRSTKDFTWDASTVMDEIRRGYELPPEERTFTYSDGHGESIVFTEALAEAVTEYVNDAFAAIQQRWGVYMNEIVQYVVIGGSAALPFDFRRGSNNWRQRFSRPTLLHTPTQFLDLEGIASLNLRSHAKLKPQSQKDTSPSAQTTEDN